MKRAAALTGAAFLMATSAIGPGFITQTTVFTQSLGTSFGFIILISIVLDVAAQMNIWRIISVSGKRAQDLANEVLPGMGYLLALLVLIGGLAFNIGNIGGAGLGLNVVSGLDTTTGAVISAGNALIIFWVRQAGLAMDWFARILGFVMIAMTLYAAFSSAPPLGAAVRHSFLPERFNMLAVVTLVGGTVGGYISFAGAHRLLDANVTGIANVREVSAGSLKAVGLASLMRILLFLAALGVVVKYGTLSKENPAADVFRLAAGEIGYRIFGIVLWCAAITSVVGSAYTSVSFLRTLNTFVDRNHRMVITVFILISTLAFAFVQNPIRLLVAVGALNGFILPAALAMMLIAVHKNRVHPGYKHPKVLTLSGWLVVLLMTAALFHFLFTIIP